MYTIKYPMVHELLKLYQQRLHLLEKHEGTSSDKTLHIQSLQKDIIHLTTQLRKKGYDTDSLMAQIREEIEPSCLYEKLSVYIDGAVRNHDRHEKTSYAGVSFIVFGDDKQLFQGAKYLGQEIRLPRLHHDKEEPGITQITNNVAEYCGLLEALEFLLEKNFHAKDIHIYSDSFMVVSQVNMNASTRSPTLKQLRNCALQLLQDFRSIQFSYIPRTENVIADRLVNDLLDKIIPGLEQMEGEVS